MSSGKILIVEDEIGYQELAAAVLAADYALTICQSGEEAAAKLDAEPFDLVISDINMFGMTGLELLAKVQRDGKSEICPVILCSSQSDAWTRERAIELGAAGFLSKPYPLDALTAVVRALVPLKK